MPKKHERPTATLSSAEVRRTANRSSYGGNQETVTRNTGLILTDYMMKSLTATKLKEEAEGPKVDEPKKSAEERRREEAQRVLDDVFEDYSKTHADYSSFGFVNEVSGLAPSTDSPSLNPSSVDTSPAGSAQNSARNSSGPLSPMQSLR